jgi:lysophospholipase L1-like esterase
MSLSSPSGLSFDSDFTIKSSSPLYGAKICTIGDSIMAGAVEITSVGGSSATPAHAGMRGFVNSLQFKCGSPLAWRFENYDGTTVGGNNFAVSGDSGFDVKDRISNAIKQNPDILWVHLGTNDITAGSSAETIVAFYRWIVYECSVRGISVWFDTILPRYFFSLAQEAIRDNVNAALLNFENEYKGRVLVFNFEGMTSPTYFSDGTHPNKTGADWMADNVIIPKLSAFYGLQRVKRTIPADYNAYTAPLGNLLTNSAFTGSGGTVGGTNNTGVVPDSWQSASGTGSTASVVFSTEQKTDWNGNSSNFVKMAGTTTGAGVDKETRFLTPLVGGSALTTQNIVTGGAFSSATGWTLGAGWAVSGGKANATASSAAISQTSATTIIAGVAYAVTYTIDSVAAGSVTVSVGGVSGTARTAAGTYTEIIIATAANQTLALTGTAFTGVIDTFIVSSAVVPGQWYVVEQELIADPTTSGLNPVRSVFLQLQDSGTDGPVSNAFNVGYASANFITNGDFASAAGWTLGAGWSIGAGVATATTSSAAITKPSIAELHANKVLQITYTITRSAGSVQVYIGGTTGVARTSNGTYTETIVTAATDQLIGFVGTGFSGTLDNITCVVPEYFTEGAQRQLLRTFPICIRNPNGLSFRSYVSYDGTIAGVRNCYWGTPVLRPLGFISDQGLAPQTETPLTGGTVYIRTGPYTNVHIDPAGTLSTLTIVMPPSPQDGDVAQFVSTGAVTTLTMTSLRPVNGPLTALIANIPATYQYNKSKNEWFRIA